MHADDKTTSIHTGAPVIDFPAAVAAEAVKAAPVPPPAAAVGRWTAGCHVSPASPTRRTPASSITSSSPRPSTMTTSSWWTRTGCRWCCSSAGRVARINISPSIRGSTRSEGERSICTVIQLLMRSYRFCGCFGCVGVCALVTAADCCWLEVFCCNNSGGHLSAAAINRFVMEIDVQVESFIKLAPSEFNRSLL